MIENLSANVGDKGSIPSQEYPGRRKMVTTPVCFSGKSGLTEGLGIVRVQGVTGECGYDLATKKQQ